MLFTEFESRCREFSQREAREGDAAPRGEGAITLMTVHGSKGLEFPLVVLADAGKWRPPSGTAVLAPDGGGGLAARYTTWGRRPQTHGRLAPCNGGPDRESLDERRRLLYVASTRARDYLIVCASHDGRPGDEGWLAWLHEALDLKGRRRTCPGASAGARLSGAICPRWPQNVTRSRMGQKSRRTSRKSPRRMSRASNCPACAPCRQNRPAFCMSWPSRDCQGISSEGSCAARD